MKNGCKNTVIDKKLAIEDGKSRDKVGCLDHNLNPLGVDGITQQTDKYDLQSYFRPQHREVITKAKDAPVFKKWDKQTVDKYGFIPLSQLLLPDVDNKNPRVK